MNSLWVTTGRGHGRVHQSDDQAATWTSKSIRWSTWLLSILGWPRGLILNGRILAGGEYTPPA